MHAQMAALELSLDESIALKERDVELRRSQRPLLGHSSELGVAADSDLKYASSIGDLPTSVKDTPPSLADMPFIKLKRHLIQGLGLPQPEVDACMDKADCLALAAKANASHPAR